MNRHRMAMLAINGMVLSCVAAAPILAQTPLGTAFTYQGHLTEDGASANGTYDLRFMLYDADVGGSQVGPIVTRDDATVTDGSFTVSLDFGAVFNGNKRFLEIAVRPGASSGSYTTLSGRQELTPAPNAVFSQSAATAPWSGLIGVPAGFADDTDNDRLSAMACAIGQIPKRSVLGWECAVDTDTNSGGTVTSITAGTGLTGGTIRTSGTIGVDFGTTGTSVANGDHNHYGQSWSGSGNGLMVTSTTAGGVGGYSSSSNGIGVHGNVTAVTGVTLGVRGDSSSTSGVGVVGRASATVGETYGVYGETVSPAGYGVQGYATATSGNNYGVRGVSNSTEGRGVYGLATATVGRNYGVYGQADSTDGFGVSGWATATSGVGIGVYARTDSIDGAGVYALATTTSGFAEGVLGRTNSTLGTGVVGVAFATSGYTYGLRGQSDSTLGRGVAGFVFATSGVNYGVWGLTDSPGGYAGYFDGNVEVTGNLTKGGGAFKIDHPLDPENRYLYHSFVESPDMKNVYDGVVTTDASGYATIEMPEWFEALNRDFRYQLTVVGDGAWARARVYRKIAANRFVIQTDLPAVEVSWQVTGIRKDAWAEAHRIKVEEDKTGDEMGTYLHPAVFGQPKEMGLDFKRRPPEADRSSLRGAEKPVQK